MLCSSDFRSASPASSTVDLVDNSEPSPLTEFRARHITRVVDQRDRLRRNPPSRIRTVYTCRPYARSFASQRQLSYHKTSGRQAHALNRLHDLVAQGWTHGGVTGKRGRSIESGKNARAALQAHVNANVQSCGGGACSITPWGIYFRLDCDWIGYCRSRCSTAPPHGLTCTPTCMMWEVGTGTHGYYVYCQDRC